MSGLKVFGRTALRRETPTRFRSVPAILAPEESPMSKKIRGKAPALRSSPLYDAAGHIHPNRASHLLALARSTRLDEPDGAFSEATADDLAEELAEAAVNSMTTGED